MAAELPPSGTVRRTSPQLRHPGERRNISKSAIRALDVLEYFAIVKRPLRATDIAHALELHPSSTDQLLKTMVDSAYLLIDPMEKLYYPSPRLVRFANWLTSGYYGGENLCRLIETLAAQTGDTVTLSAPHGAWLQIVDVAEPVTSPGLIRKGSRAAVLTSTIGEAFLAAQTDHEVTRWIRRTPEARRMDDGEIRILLDSLRAPREAGYVCGLSDENQLFSIAMALPRPAAGALLVLGLAGPFARTSNRVEELVGLMRKAIATHLGG